MKPGDTVTYSDAPLDRDVEGSNWYQVVCKFQLQHTWCIVETLYMGEMGRRHLHAVEGVGVRKGIREDELRWATIDERAQLALRRFELV